MHEVTDADLALLGAALGALIEGKMQIEESDWATLIALLTKTETEPTP